MHALLLKKLSGLFQLLSKVGRHKSFCLQLSNMRHFCHYFYYFTTNLSHLTVRTSGVSPNLCPRVDRIIVLLSTRILSTLGHTFGDIPLQISHRMVTTTTKRRHMMHHCAKNTIRNATRVGKKQHLTDHHFCKTI